MPGVTAPPVGLSTSSSKEAQSLERPFRTILHHLRNNPSPRHALLLQLSKILPPDTRSPVLRAQRDALQSAIVGHSTDDGTLLDVAAKASDAFLSVRIIGARAKASAFFDHLSFDHCWSHVAIMAGSTVAETCFLALNRERKRLTVIDIGPPYHGRQTAERLASQTQAPVRYSTLASSGSSLEMVDVLIIGATEVCMNGSVITSFGGGALVSMAREHGADVVVATQTAKFSERMVVGWCDTGDVISHNEILAVVTEVDTGAWKSSSAPDLLRRMHAV